MDRDVGIHHQGHEIADRIGRDGLEAGAAAVSEILAAEVAPLTMSSSEGDIVAEVQTRSSLSAILEKKRLAAVEAPVRAQFCSCTRSSPPTIPRRR